LDTQWILNLVAHYGYLALFLCLFLGIAGLPINDETLVMLAGFTGARGLLAPLPAFLVTYGGVLSGMNIGFVLGRLLDASLLDWLSARSPRMRHHLDRARQWLARRGVVSIWLTYYLPGIRHVVPYLLGIGDMPYGRFALIAFSGGLVWTTVFYILGYELGANLEAVGVTVHRYGLYAAALLAVGALLFWLWRRRRGAAGPTADENPPPG